MTSRPEQTAILEVLNQISTSTGVTFEDEILALRSAWNVALSDGEPREVWDGARPGQKALDAL